MVRDILVVNPFIMEAHENLIEYLGIGYITSSLRTQGYNVEVLDGFVEPLTVDKICSHIDEDCKIVIFSLMSQECLENTSRILNTLKDLNSDIFKAKKVILGGLYASLYYKEIMESEDLVDFIIRGEGEASIVKLADYITKSSCEISDIPNLVYKNQGQVFENALCSFEDDLDSISFPARDTLSKVLKGNFKKASIASSRGCYGRCKFCMLNKYISQFDGNRWRYRSPKNIVDEIEALIKEYNITKFHFIDEDFIGPGEVGQNRAIAIGDEMLKRSINIEFSILARTNYVSSQVCKSLKEAGLKEVFLGIEFGVQRLLDFYNKKTTVEENIRAIKTLESLDITVHAGYIMFEPIMDLDTFKENFIFYFDYIADFDISKLTHKLIIYPKTEIYSKLQELIEVDEKVLFTTACGNYHRYKFKDKKVYILYQGLLRLLSSRTIVKKAIELDSLPVKDKIKQIEKIKEKVKDIVLSIITYLENNKLEDCAKNLPKYIDSEKIILEEMFNKGMKTNEIIL